MLNRRCHARIGLAIVGMFWSASLMAMPSHSYLILQRH